MSAGLSGVTGGILTARFAFFLIGLMFIAGSLYAFKTTQTIIQTGTRAVKTGAKAAEVIAS